jgi:endonuclease/exonuclease/phosphatase family metal-dependent hydrolase
MMQASALAIVGAVFLSTAPKAKWDEQRAQDIECKGTPFQVVTFNLYNRPIHKDERVTVTSELLTQLNANIVVLQEDGHLGPWGSIPSRQLATDLGLKRYHALLDNDVFARSGLSVLSKYPIESAGVVKFHQNRFFQTKGFVWARLQVCRNTHLLVINVHLAARVGGDIKASQFAELKNFIERERRTNTIVVMGDFNEDATTPLMKAFQHELQLMNLFDSPGFHQGRVATWLGSYGKRCREVSGDVLDYIFIANTVGETSNNFAIEFLNGRVVMPLSEPPPSDHCPVTATLQMKPHKVPLLRNRAAGVN